jgi:non-homologous end joining protein Ku
MRCGLYKIGFYGACRAMTLITALVGDPETAALAIDARNPPLVLEATIPLEGVTGRIDHMAVDTDKHRLVVAELGNNTVDVIDLKTQRAVHRIKGLHEPQGVGDLAVQLITKKSGAFHPEKFENHYQTALKELVQEKLKGKKIISTPEVPRSLGANVVDLMAALRASVEGKKAKPTPKSKGRASKKSA